ncbi:hypothetical protein WMY93_007092 [Mugilogobius chulae]|uniref:Uncharacterized protein n=1 Tax=Mugilogobius chulae TaxID=88201 RepID=A0AAW0PM72_9GOBI
MIFQVRADSIYLTDDHNRAVLPLPNGAFESQDLLMSSHYEVHGESSASEGEASTSGQTPIRFAFRRPSNSTPTASTNHPSSRAASLKMLQRNVFIAELLDGHLETQKTVTIKFSEFEASVNNIKAKVTEALGHDEPIVLIDSHQNEIMDCEGTRGPAFWKQHARKIYAVPEEQLQRHRGKRRRESRQSDTSLPEVFDQIEEVVLASQGLQEVRADSIYLTDDHNRAVLPLPNGAFESQDLLMSSHYEVHGESSASEGEASTSGPAFWKQHARKIYAVPEEQLQRHRGKRRRESRQSDTSLPEVFDQIEEVVLASQGLQEVSSSLKELVKPCLERWRESSSLCPKCRTDDTDFQLQAVLGLEDAVAALHNFVS